MFFIAEAFLTTLKMMEENEVAHNDLSSSNVLVPFLSENAIEYQHNIELVDVEQMYGQKRKDRHYCQQVQRVTHQSI